MMSPAERLAARQSLIEINSGKCVMTFSEIISPFKISLQKKAILLRTLGVPIKLCDSPTIKKNGCQKDLL